MRHVTCRLTVTVTVYSPGATPSSASKKSSSPAELFDCVISTSPRLRAMSMLAVGSRSHANTPTPRYSLPSGTLGEKAREQRHQAVLSRPTADGHAATVLSWQRKTQMTTVWQLAKQHSCCSALCQGRHGTLHTCMQHCTSLACLCTVSCCAMPGAWEYAVIPECDVR